MKLWTGAIWAVFGGWIALAGSPVSARADRIRLRSGGEIRGVILPDSPGSERIQVQTESSARPLTLSRWQVLEVIAEDSPLVAYFAKRDAAPRTAAAQYELGAWCEEQKLRGLAELHYQHALEIDPQHESSHRKLGHVLHKDVWMSYDEMREAQGLVTYRGRWISRVEYDYELAQEARAAEDASRVRQLMPLRLNLKSASAEVVQGAERDLQGYRGPENIRALVEVFGQDNLDGRLRLARVLGAIPGPEARQALVAQVLRDPDATVHAAVVEELAHRKEPEATQDLLRALGDRDRARVSRAARALGLLGVTESVPKLIAVLVKVKQKPVLVPSRSVSSLIGPGPGSIGASVYGGPTLSPSAAGLSAAPEGTSLWLSGGGPARGPSLQLLTRVDRNADVHEALVTLTGQDFGYDAAAWRQWLRLNPTTSTGPPTRRIPQP